MDAKFTINPHSGELCTTTELDYEETKLYSLIVNATNLVNLNAITVVIIHVLDRNDNAPKFLYSTYYGEISESTEVGTFVLTNQSVPLVVSAADEDSGLNSYLQYEIVEKMPRSYFRIDSTMGLICTIQALDYERIPFFRLTVQVTDKGKPQLSGEETAEVFIRVLDVNDSPPKFVKDLYECTLLLPTYEGVAVTVVKAVDPDLDVQTEFRYSIVSGNRGAKFLINEVTGQIFIGDPENLEDKYIMVVAAKDGIFEATTKVKIRVENTRNGRMKFSKNIYMASVMENSTDVVRVTMVAVVGSVVNENVIFSILNPSDMFRIGKTSGLIQTTGKPFDWETKSNYTLVVEARSTSTTVPRVAHVLVQVTILDINDNAPIFIDLPYYSVVPIEAQPGDLIRKVHAVDLDFGLNGYVQYEMVKGEKDLFSIDKQSGEVRLQCPLTPHRTVYDVVVAAYDSGKPSLHSEIAVPIKVLNRNMPVFEKQFYVVSVPESIRPKSAVLSITAESSQGRQLIYSIIEGNVDEDFRVDFNIGVIFVVEELDYETREKYDLILRATDSVSGDYTDVSVEVHVEDVNDNVPMFRQPTYNVTVSEATPFGEPILKVHATDRDKGPNKDVYYSILGNATAYFYIDQSKGVIYIKNSLDYETRPIHHFIVVATDEGFPSLNSSANVWVVVSDINDNPPSFGNPSYKCVLSEHAERGQFVTTVVASDPDITDQSKLTYSIISSSTNQAFTINNSTGVISLYNAHQFLTQSVVLLNISVTDGVYSSYTRAAIYIQSANRHTPIFSRTVYEFAVLENLPQGTKVASVAASDKDRETYGIVRYGIESEECSSFFRINSSSGEIHARISFDREKKHLYKIPIVATDGGGQSSYSIVRLSITDSNDNDPQFLVAEYQVSVNSNTKAGTTILKVRAFDLDFGEAASLEYSIYEKTDSKIKKIFNITPDQGEIYVKDHFFKAQENTIFQFFVQAKDRGSPARQSKAPVSVHIIDPSQKSPQFEKLSYEFFINENSKIGQIIATLSVTYPEEVTYSFAPIDQESVVELYSSNFSIDSEGHILQVGELDREERYAYNLTVRVAASSQPHLTSYTDVSIILMDVNDNAPAFESSLYRVTVAENVEEGYTVAQLVAYDVDTSNNAKLVFLFGPDTENVRKVFDLNPTEGWITTKTLLDYETVTWYNFSVIVHDSGSPQLSSQTLVFIEVKDYNDNPPVFRRDYYESSVSENALEGTILILLEIEDLDSNFNDSIQFFITSGNPKNQFQITNRGEIYINKPLDRELTSDYSLTVTVSDGRFISTTTVHVDVVDVNDNPPICHMYKYTELVSESIKPETFILSVEATDKDEGKNSQLYFILTGEGAEDFYINPNSGILKTGKPLDRERQSRYNLIVYVQDKNVEKWECTTKVEILLSDVNDNVPAFTTSVYTATIPEDSKVGTLVTKVHATDTDLGAGRKISYSFIDSANGNFIIDNKTGIVRLQRSLDREQVSDYNLIVQARDHGTPSLSSIANVYIAVQDINDNPPEFLSRFYHAKVFESDEVGTELIHVRAASKDAGVNAEITYSLISGNEFGAFIIHPKSGVLSIVKSLDYEDVKQYVLKIGAKDGGTPPLTNYALVNITVIDVNDNPPVFNQLSYKVIIPEDASPGSEVIQVKASDLDSPPNSKLSFSITDGDKQSQFEIGEENGIITLSSPLDRESISSYDLQVQCKDSGTPSLSAVGIVNIEVSDINDNPPVFSQENYSAIVQEGKERGFTLHTFSVTDSDSPPNTTPFTFHIISGNEDKSFRLVQNQKDASLRTTTLFDHKYKKKYILKIRVSDNGIPSLSSDTQVVIHVVEESQFPPVVSSLEVAVTFYLDKFPGGPIGRIRTTDSDPYDEPTYDIVSHHKHLFKIDRGDGVLVAYEGLDAGNYSINVSVSDGKFTTYGTVLVNVSVVTEEAVKNSVTISLGNVTPQNFLSYYKEKFLRVVKNILDARIQDVDIISLQPSLNKSVKSHRSIRQDLDVLFAVKRDIKGFYAPRKVLKKLIKEKTTLESATGLDIVKVTEHRCMKNHCVNGKCVDRVILDKIHAIMTGYFSYVFPRHHRKLECDCEPGYGGETCEHKVNECARKPCSQHRICVPHGSFLGYTCRCPEGKTGIFCDQEKADPCVGPACFEEHPPIFFSGKSYAHYVLNISINRHLKVVLRIKTRFETGNLMYAGGIGDYSILEVVNGFIQYRFDFGSGEGLIQVKDIKVNDGSWHEVKLDRHDNSAEVVVDGQFRVSGHSPGVNELLNLERNDVFFGGEVQTMRAGDVKMGFVGCMHGIRMAGVPLPLVLAVNSTVAVLERFVRVEKFCEYLLNPGVCGSQPCLNGGTCKNHGNLFSCQCPHRFSGLLCELDSNPCASNPCLYGGICYNENNDFRCECAPGLTGKRCNYGYNCNPNPCKNGGTCEEGVSDPSFQCHCQPNMTGHVCTESRFTSTSLNMTKENIIVAVLVFIVGAAIIIVCCCRFYRHKQHQRPQNNNTQEGSSNSLVLKNLLDMHYFSKKHKVNNLGVFPFITPSVRPHATSYTYNTQESVNNYGRATADLENIPHYSNKFVQNTNNSTVNETATLTPVFNSTSNLDSFVKKEWNHDMERSNYQNKIQNELKFAKSVKAPTPVPLMPSRGPSSLGVSSQQSSLNSLSGYQWDCSDWANAEKPLDDTMEISRNKISDSSSVKIADPNSQIQFLWIPDADASVDLDYPSTDVIGDNDSQGNDGPLSSHFKYICHLNQYLPVHKQPWSYSGNQRQPSSSNQSEDDISACGFSPQRGKGFLLDGAGCLSRNSRLDCLSIEDYKSANSSSSNISTNLCEVEDNEVNSDVHIEFSNRQMSENPNTGTVIQC